MHSPSKVTAEHLRRLAYLYVRQSSLQQVQEHRESTARQYDLQRRAQALGWSAEQIVVIDEDLGLSGASATERSGFQRLVAEVGLGRVGIVMGLEVSRLARNSTDWHRLLEICALTETLILRRGRASTIPSHFNDRLLLGLKGTMSEAELHVLRARLLGGQLNKARRGELWMRRPIGFVYDARPSGSCSIPTRRSRPPCVCSSRPSGAPARRGQVVRHFARAGPALAPPALHRGRGRRARLRAAGSQPRARHPPQSALRRRVRVWAHAPAESDRRRPDPLSTPAARGVEESSCPTPIRGTSPGRSSRPTRPASWRMPRAMGRIDAGVRRGKAWPSCRAW